MVSFSIMAVRYWELKKEMAPGSEPQNIQSILSTLRPICDGLSLCGAGAGGYAVVILKRDVPKSSLEQLVMELNRQQQQCEDEGSESGMLSVHEVCLDSEGVVTKR